jgi:hypothetical protein
MATSAAKATSPTSWRTNMTNSTSYHALSRALAVSTLRAFKGSESYGAETALHWRG